MFNSNDALNSFSPVTKFRKSESSLCVLTEAAVELYQIFGIHCSRTWETI
jgi:hypothetical protein